LIVIMTPTATIQTTTVAKV